MSIEMKNSCQFELILSQDKEDLADKAARLIAYIVSETKKLKNKSTVNIALSGGSTPAALYKRLLADDMSLLIDWSSLHFYLSDERAVAHESNESNYGNAYRQLLKPRNIEAVQLHPTQMQDKDTKESARLYQELIRRNIDCGKNGIPEFDLILLGMGADGHTASLFPGTQALEEEFDLVLSNHVPKLNTDRITFSYPLINAAANVIFLVAGKDKSPVLNEIFTEHAGKYPCEKVNPKNGRLIWILDRDAASELDR